MDTSQNVLFIDTGGGFDAERLAEMVAARKKNENVMIDFFTYISAVEPSLAHYSEDCDVNLQKIRSMFSWYFVIKILFG